MVYFVGAGPGAPDLITVRGQELLKRADIIIYAGSLVNAQLLKAAPACCLIYNSAVMTLEEVMEVMVQGLWQETMPIRIWRARRKAAGKASWRGKALRYAA